MELLDHLVHLEATWSCSTSSSTGAAVELLDHLVHLEATWSCSTTYARAVRRAACRSRCVRCVRVRCLRRAVPRKRGTRHRVGMNAAMYHCRSVILGSIAATAVSTGPGTGAAGAAGAAVELLDGLEATWRPPGAARRPGGHLELLDGLEATWSLQTRLRRRCAPAAIGAPVRRTAGPVQRVDKPSPQNDSDGFPWRCHSYRILDARQRLSVRLLAIP